MIKFKTLSIQNFLSYGNAPIILELDKIGTTLIVGEDLDNTSSGTGANGVGKTAWVNALVYALYGKPISNISMDNLINNINKKNLRVEVEFENNGNIITVRRARKEKGIGNYAKVFIRPLGTALNEKEHDKTPDSVANINDFIVEYLGIPYELFIRIVTFTATHTPFLDLPLRQQCDIMEELFSLTQLSVKAEILKSETKGAKQSLEIKIKHNEQLEKEHERHNGQLVSAKTRVDDWENNQQEEILNIEKELKEYKSIPVKEQENLYKKVAEIKDVLGKEKPKQKDIENIITEISGKFTIVETNIKTMKEEKTRIVTWREDNINKISMAKKSANKIPEEHILKEQLKLHTELNSLTEEVNEFTEQKIRFINNIDNVISAIDKEKKELNHLIEAKCPYCLQKYEGAAIKINKCNETIKTKQQEEIDTKELLNVIVKNISSLESGIKNISNKIKFSLDEINKHELLRVDHVKKLEELLNEKCPFGDFSIVKSMNITISNLENESKAFKKDIDKEADSLVKIDKLIADLENELNDCENAITIDSLDKLYEIKNNISQRKIKIKELKSVNNPYLEPLNELENIKLDSIDMDAVNDLNNLITHQNYLVKLLTKKDSFIRKSLLNKNLAFLNQRLYKYLAALGLPHRVEFTHEMTAKITQFGRELDFGNLSSGQKARVNLGLAFSFRDVLQKSHDSINVCMLDEVLDVGLDTVGVQNAARMLKRKARDEDLALYIISHRDEVSSIFDNIMVVQMEKGFSSIKIEK